MHEISPYFIRREFSGELQVPPPSCPPSAQVRIPTLREWWNVIRHRLSLIVSIVLAVTALTVIGTLLMTPSYTAQSTVLIEPQAPQVLDIRSLANDVAGADEHEYYETQYRIFKSRALALQVIGQLNLETDALFAHQSGPLTQAWQYATGWIHPLYSRTAPPARAETGESEADTVAIEDYLSRLQILPQLGTRLIAVGFSTPDAQLSARIANAHVQAYIRRGMELHAQASEDARSFLEKKLVELRDRVERSEAALNDYRRDRGIVTFELQDKGKILMDRLTELNGEFTKAESERIALGAEVDLVDKGQVQSLSQVINNPLIQKLKAEVADVSDEYAQMSSRFTADYHPLVELGAKLSEARGRLNAEIQRSVDGIKSDYAAANGREAKLSAEISQVKDQALALNDASLQDAVLAREVDTNRELYKSVLERMKELGVAAEVPGSNVSIVDRATPPRSPSSPKILLTAFASALLSLIGAIALAFVLDHLDDHVKDPEDAQALLQLPNLGLVPDFAAAHALAYGPAGPPPLEPAAIHSSEMVTEASRFSVAAEVYRSLRTAILYSRAGRPPRTVLVTSGVSGEGKTVTAINLAIAFAHVGGRILLVDTDMRRSRCHEVLETKNDRGLAEVLAGQCDLNQAIKHTRVEGLDILSAGAVPPNPTELLGSDKMQEVLKKLGEDYSYVVLDAAPVIPVSDSIILSTMSEAILFVLGPQTPRQAAAAACNRLRGVGAKLIGLVMNQVDLRQAAYYAHGTITSYGYRRAQQTSAN